MEQHFISSLDRYLDKKPKCAILSAALLLDLLIGYIDFVTGFEIHITIFYLIPLFIAVRFAEKRDGVIMTFLCTATIAIADYAAGEWTFLRWQVILWDLFLTESFFLVVVLLSFRIKTDIEERIKLIGELESALTNVKMLSGLLPMCASCKKIRDDKGYWTQVETYISTHTEATFTHGLCPECIKKLYPEHYEEIMGKEEEKG